MWDEALEYCRWLEDGLKSSPATPTTIKQLLDDNWHLGLPSEAEWEKAARGTDGRIFPWGNSIDPRRVHVNAMLLPPPIGLYPTGASPFGVLDMIGSGWEWTRSAYRPYPYDPKDGREDLEKSQFDRRVVRGTMVAAIKDLKTLARRQFYNSRTEKLLSGFRIAIYRP